METTPINNKDYCNLLAQGLGLDPAGSAGHFADAIILETPLPWKREIYQSADPLPQELIDLLALWLERYHATGVYNHRPLMIAPDAEYSQPGYRRVIYYSRATGEFARFQKTEYLIPEDQAGPLIWALFEARDQLPLFEAYRVPEADRLRDLLVCTHGTIDVACAKFGFPLYRHLRDTYAGSDCRVWRVSHFGGHVYAPTLVDMPTGHYWAYVEQEQATQIVGRSGPVQNLVQHYRGWSGLPGGFPQVAERAVWQEEGWCWFDCERTCTILDHGSNDQDSEDQDSGDQNSEDEDSGWMKLRIDYTRPDHSRGAYEVHVQVTHTIETVPGTGRTDRYSYPQYAVTTLTRLEADELQTAGIGMS